MRASSGCHRRWGAGQEAVDAKVLARSVVAMKAAKVLPIQVILFMLATPWQSDTLSFRSRRVQLGACKLNFCSTLRWPSHRGLATSAVSESRQLQHFVRCAIQARTQVAGPCVCFTIVCFIWFKSRLSSSDKYLRVSPPSASRGNGSSRWRSLSSSCS